MQILHIPIHFASVFGVLAVLSTLLGILAFKKGNASEETVLRFGDENRWLLVLGVLVSALFVARAFLSPLQGYDTYFRWNFLATQILQHGNFAFYPPLTPEDFRQYFYVDSIPPMVQFSYWWLYASFGRAAESLTGIFVSIQFFLLLAVTFRMTYAVGNSRSATFATAALLASPLFFWSVFLGQETGLTALSLSSCLFFIASDKQKCASRVILAAMAASVGALSREYGCAFIFCGLIALLWLRFSPKHVLLFLLVSFLIVAPWYLRTWVLTGNPVYSLPIGHLFPVNPVHVGILEVSNSVQGFATDTFIKFTWLIKLFLQYSPLQFVLGILMVPFVLKRAPYLWLCCLIVILIWIYNAGIAAGGYFWSLRVLSPAIVLLSVAIGLGLDQLAAAKKEIATLFSVLIGIAMCSAICKDLTIPITQGWIPSSQWFNRAFTPNRQFSAMFDILGPALSPLKTRILSDDAYAHAGLLKYGIEVVPVWSPEVGFIFDPANSPQQVRNRLNQIGISAVEYDPKGLSSLYLSRASFFAEDIRNWRPYKSAGHSTIYLLPAN
ncbi:MAG TPA: hypothetical protein VFG11_02570 [Acidobacteriota bacterium]|nr:hypothetical protein [Acidobacteriota bacterium]